MSGFSAPRATGISGCPASSTSRRALADSLMIETYGHGYGQVEIGRAVIKDNYKYVIFQHGPVELYDLDADPYELHNLAADPAYQGVIETMRAELRRLQQESGDDEFGQPVSEEFLAEDRQRFQELLERRATVP